MKGHLLVVVVLFLFGCESMPHHAARATYARYCERSDGSIIKLVVVAAIQAKLPIYPDGGICKYYLKSDDPCAPKTKEAE